LLYWPVQLFPQAPQPIVITVVITTNARDKNSLEKLGKRPGRVPGLFVPKVSAGNG